MKINISEISYLGRVYVPGKRFAIIFVLYFFFFLKEGDTNGSLNQFIFNKFNEIVQMSFSLPDEFMNVKMNKKEPVFIS